ncbi:MAG: SIMPL domain-containing protein [Thermoguttaceae bacterium]
MPRRESLWLIAVLLIAGSPATVVGQVTGDSSVTVAQAGGLAAVGSASVRKQPTRLRMHIELLAKGKNLEEALAKLKDRREAAVLQLETLKVDKKSIVFEGPTKSAAQAAQKRQIEAMIMEQMRSRGKKPKGLQVPQTVTVTGSLTAEWPLEAKSRDQLLLAANAIEEKVSAADISGSREVQKLSPEEEELAEEARQQSNRYGETPQAVGQPTFLFIAVLSKQERQKAMAEAYRKAAAAAAELAKATDVDLGRLVNVVGVCRGQQIAGDEEENSYASRMAAMRLQRLFQQAVENAGEKLDESFSDTPTPLTFTCTVMATFAMKKK